MSDDGEERAPRAVEEEHERDDEEPEHRELADRRLARGALDPGLHVRRADRAARRARASRGGARSPSSIAARSASRRAGVVRVERDRQAQEASRRRAPGGGRRRSRSRSARYAAAPAAVGAKPGCVRAVDVERRVRARRPGSRGARASSASVSASTSGRQGSSASRSRITTGRSGKIALERRASRRSPDPTGRRARRCPRPTGSPPRARRPPRAAARTRRGSAARSATIRGEHAGQPRAHRRGLGRDTSSKVTLSRTAVEGRMRFP